MYSDSRLDAVFHSAVNFFITKGYRQTQISDIAKDAGLATGSIYNLFSGKKAIFQFVVKGIFSAPGETLAPELPVGEVEAYEFEEFVKNMLGSIFDTLYQQLENLPFTDKVALLYDKIVRYGAGFLIFEHNTIEWQQVSKIYFEQRAVLLRAFEKILADSITAGEVRPLEHSDCHARVIIETLSFWGMHVPYEINDIAASPEDEKRVVLDALSHAYSVL